MKWGLWSTTAASNSSTPPDGWPEGQAPSTVNDCAREMMAAIRTGMNDIGQGYIDLGMVPTFVSSTKFTVPGDATPYLPVGTRLRASDASTLYGQVISASFSTNSAFTVTLDSGNLTSSLTSIAVSVIKSGSTNQNIPNPFATIVATTLTATTVNAATLNAPTISAGSIHMDGTLSLSSTNGVPIAFLTNSTFCGMWLRCSGGAKMVRVSSASVFEIVNSSNTTVVLSLTDAGGLTASGDITAFSDERMKEDWNDLPRDFIRQLAAIHRSGTFTKDGERHVGVGAQSLIEILPEAVMENADGILSVAYGNAALAACVELSRKVVDLERRLDQVENRR